MPKLGKHLIKNDNKKRVAQTTKQILVSVLLILFMIILILALNIGDFLWPAWMVEYRTQIIGVVSFFTVCLIVLSPIIIEANSHPRTLSGPGKDPRGDGWSP